MNLLPVHTFLLGEGRTTMPELADVDEHHLLEAERLYKLYKGRLPSPRPPEPPDPSEELKQYKQEFQHAIQQFLDRTDDKDAEHAFSNSSWENVQAEADKAWAAYDGHRKRRMNLRREPGALDHRAGQTTESPYFEFLMELIPGGNYTSILLGGLTLVYNAALRKKAVREDILTLFESLSERAKETKDRIKLYRHDVELQAKSEKLYMAVLDCVHLSITWLDQKSARESFKAFFKQSGYAAHLEKAKSNLDRKAKEFQDAVDLCLQKEVHEIHGGVEELKAASTAIFSLLAGFLKDFPGILASQLEEARKAQPALPNVINHSQFIMPHPQPMAFTICSLVLRQYLAVDHSSASRHGQDPVTAAVSELEADVTAAMKSIPSSLERERMGFLTQTPGFLSWLHAANSTFLIAHELEVSHQGSLSTLSHLCGLMAKSLHTPGMWTAAAFCGLHTPASATFQGGMGLMRSVTLQLLSQVPADAFPAPTDPLTVARELKAGNVNIICSVFSMVLENLRAGMIFVLIDGAHWNASEARMDEMRAVVRFLYKAVGRLRLARRGLALKVMITNPTSRQRASWEIDTEDLRMERAMLRGGFEGAEAEVLADMALRSARR